MRTRAVRKTYQSQPRLSPGHRRIPGYHGLIQETQSRVQRDADRYGVSKSWVVASILATYYKVDAQVDFRKGVK